MSIFNIDLLVSDTCYELNVIKLMVEHGGSNNKEALDIKFEVLCDAFKMLNASYFKTIINRNDYLELKHKLLELKQEYL